MPWRPESNIPVLGNGPSDALAGVPQSMPPHALKEVLVFRCDEIQRIASDNSLVLEDILHRRQELAVIEDEIHTLTKQTIPRLHADNELEFRDIIQGGLKLEEEMHALEPIKAEVLHLRSEQMELEALHEELSAKVQSLYRELEQIQSENKQIPGITAEFRDLQEEILRARMAYDYEKQAKVELLEQRQAMEGKFFDMKMEALRLKAELERRVRRPVRFKPHGSGPY